MGKITFPGSAQVEGHKKVSQRLAMLDEERSDRRVEQSGKILGRGFDTGHPVLDPYPVRRESERFEHRHPGRRRVHFGWGRDGFVRLHVR
jgi:hypothetical protein